jgi:hypothetical protein
MHDRRSHDLQTMFKKMKRYDLVIMICCVVQLLVAMTLAVAWVMTWIVKAQ